MHTAPFLLFAEHQCIGCATHSHSQNTLEHTAKGELRLVSNTLQYTATRKLHKGASRTPHTVKDCKLSFTREQVVGAILQQTALNCNTLKRTATYCNNTLQHIATHCNRRVAPGNTWRALHFHINKMCLAGAHTHTWVVSSGMRAWESCHHIYTQRLSHTHMHTHAQAYAKSERKIEKNAHTRERKIHANGERERARVCVWV